MKQGIIQIYTGEGKGKTTAAFGQALRAAGRGLKVIIIQFFKNRPSGEVLALEKHLPQIAVYRCHSQKKFIWKMETGELEILKKETLEGWQRAIQSINHKSCDLLILDEIMYPLKYQFLNVKEIIDLLNRKPPDMEVLLTGREVPRELLDQAQLVTEMKKIKHPFDLGIPMREGIEY